MTNAISTFNFTRQKQIRIISSNNNNPLFVATDVAKALGYKDLTNAVKQFCKGVVKRHTLLTGGGKQKLRVIHEPDVYRLIFGSKLKSATKFQNWVFEEVLPSIRKTGQYTQAPIAAHQPPILAAEGQNMIWQPDRMTGYMIDKTDSLPEHGKYYLGYHKGEFGLFMPHPVNKGALTPAYFPKAISPDDIAVIGNAQPWHGQFSKEMITKGSG